MSERVWFVFVWDNVECVWLSICLSKFVWNWLSSCPQMPVRLWVDVYEVRSLPVSLVFCTTIQLHRSYCNSLHLRAAVRWLHLLSFRCAFGCDALGNCTPVRSVTWYVMLALFPIIGGLTRQKPPIPCIRSVIDPLHKASVWFTVKWCENLKFGKQCVWICQWMSLFVFIFWTACQMCCFSLRGLFNQI